MRYLAVVALLLSGCAFSSGDLLGGRVVADVGAVVAPVSPDVVLMTDGRFALGVELSHMILAAANWMRTRADRNYTCAQCRVGYLEICWRFRRAKCPQNHPGRAN